LAGFSASHSINGSLEPFCIKRKGFFLFLFFSLKRELAGFLLYIGRFYKLVSKVGWCFYLAWMSFRLSHHIFLFFIQSRSPLRSFIENKNIWHDRQKFIAS
ncbi:MAG: hypothetical protein SO133_05015, partial [Alloprevotella sp.]|nr:hypothetical protein [Alloprevotella sp.]